MLAKVCDFFYLIFFFTYSPYLHTCWIHTNLRCSFFCIYRPTLVMHNLYREFGQLSSDPTYLPHTSRGSVDALTKCCVGLCYYLSLQMSDYMFSDVPSVSMFGLPHKTGSLAWGDGTRRHNSENGEGMGSALRDAENGREQLGVQVGGKERVPALCSCARPSYLHNLISPFGK